MKRLGPGVYSAGPALVLRLGELLAERNYADTPANRAMLTRALVEKAAELDIGVAVEVERDYWCDVSHCPNLPVWVHIGEAGDLYLCAEHFDLSAAGGWLPIDGKVHR